MSERPPEEGNEYLTRFIEARNLLSDTSQGYEEPLDTLRQLPTTVGWVYALTSLGGALIHDAEKRDYVARGQLVLRLAAEKMKIAFDGDIHTLLFDYEWIAALQVRSDDIEGAQFTARSIKPHLKAASKTDEASTYGNTLQRAISSVEEILRSTP